MTHLPQRTCVGCRAVAPAAELVRLVLAEGQLRPAATSAGRGAWLHARPACVQSAVKARAFSRSFRQAVTSSSTEDLLAALAAAVQPRP